jgi:hypothetical protein
VFLADTVCAACELADSNPNNGAKSNNQPVRWILDSAATRHLVSDRSLLAGCKPSPN